MQLVIPMSGLGNRFIQAGYQDIKPLIKVDGRPIIEWVLKMFPGNTKPIFICREEHLANTNLEEELKKTAPSGKIIPIKGHRKGPVYAVSKVFSEIEDNAPVMTTYCDYYMRWDFQKFTEEVLSNRCDGAIPCYTGFHPNLLPEKNLYASCRTDKNGYLIEIREKYSFSKEKSKALHSPGAYYFKSGAILKKYFQLAMDSDLSLNGEYYISLVYNLLVKDGLKVYVPPNVKHFCQWGTPEDLEEYQFWMNNIRNITYDSPHSHGRRREPV